MSETEKPEQTTMNERETSAPIRAKSAQSSSSSVLEKHSPLPICCVTGRIAGDRDACGDCDPCGAAYSVAEPVKALLRERDDWAERYSIAMGERDDAINVLPGLVKALEEITALKPANMKSNMAHVQLERAKNIANAALAKLKEHAR